MALQSSDVTKFLMSVDVKFRPQLVNEIGPARIVNLIQFKKFLNSWHNPIERIAIVSGSLSEPELLLISGSKSVTLLNFEDDPNLFDLNKDWSQEDWSSYHNSFDLVLCEQVLEHVLNPKQAVQNLAFLLKPNGLLHVTVPAINNSHGEPFYYYAGFPERTLNEFATGAGLTVRESGSWMSDKASRMYATCNWAPVSHSGSLLQMILGLWLSKKSGQGIVNIIYGRIKNFATYPFQKLFSLRDSTNAVETFLFAEKSKGPLQSRP